MSTHIKTPKTMGVFWHYAKVGVERSEHTVIIKNLNIVGIVVYTIPISANTRLKYYLKK